MSQKMNVLWVIQRSMVEMGLPKPVEAVSNSDITVQQMVTLLDRAGTDMVAGYPWTHLIKEFVFTTVEGQVSYDLPDDWSYFINQSQWDRTNHWPLLGPKTAAEWQWLKGGILSSGPRIRYRVFGDKFEIFPANNSGESELAMEYVSANWLQDANLANTGRQLVQSDSDIILFDPWLVSAYLKLKYWESKGLDTTAYTKDFVGLWDTKIGKSAGAPILTTAPRARSMLIGINNIPDGSWNVGNGSAP